MEGYGHESYAVFIYDCDNMGWSGGLIGWQASSTNYVAHDLSGESNNSEIACLYSKQQSAILYRICKLHFNFLCV